MKRAYEYRHIVGFEETNVVGNVYYVNHVRWQGRCRELFLRDHAPGVVAELEADLALATVRCSCEYLNELRALDEIAVRMRLASVVQNRIAFEFEYWRIDPSGNEELIARGEQEIACMRREGAALVVTQVPAELSQALEPFRG